MTLLRTRRDGCWELQTNSYGTFLQPSDDPLADTVITEAQLEGFELIEGHSAIPADLWERWIQLCIEMTRRNSANLEVSCRLLRKADDLTQYRIVVPEQVVSGVSVRVDSFDKAIDIETGEVISQWPPEGWLPCGSSHSHNSMEAFFSGTDDKYELGDPGIHIVVGTIDPVAMTYTLKASVTANKRRFDVDSHAVVQLDSPTTDGVTYHPSVLDAVTLPKSTTVTRSMGLPPLPPLPRVGSLDAEGSTFSRRHTDGDYSKVTPEMEDVMDAIEKLQLACTTRNVEASAVLNRLSFEIEDLAAAADNARFIEDPFWYSSY